MEEFIQQTLAISTNRWGILALWIIGLAWLWEDAAVFLAAILALDDQLSLMIALLASFVGIVSGDAALYTLGRYGARWRWLRKRVLGSHKGRLLRKRFRHRTLSNIFLIRFIPGLRTLGFTLCGIWRVPAMRFYLAMTGAGVVWIATVFSAIHVVGMSDAVRESNWKWSLMGVAALLLVFNNLYAARLNRVAVSKVALKSSPTNLASGGLEHKRQSKPNAAPLIQSGVNTGLPQFTFKDKTTSFFEFWPVWLMYIPVGFYWFWLAIRYRSFGLPLLVNPNIPLGGMVGESKKAIFNQAGSRLSNVILPFIVVTPTQYSDAESVLARAQKKGLQLPLVAKPDKGCRGSGVSLITTEAQLQTYLDNADSEREFLLQQLAPFQAEAGVFYIRYPNQSSGKVVSLALKYRPTIVGDGKLSVEQLIYAHPRAHKLAKLHCRKNKCHLDRVLKSGEEFALEFAGSHCRGSIFRDGNQYITPELSAVMDGLLQDLPEFYYGRLDIKFCDLTSLQQGKDFYIVEINGVSSEQAHIWDSRTSFGVALHTLLKQYRTLFEMGNDIRAKGYAVPSLVLMIRTWITELKKG